MLASTTYDQNEARPSAPDLTPAQLRHRLSGLLTDYRRRHCLTQTETAGLLGIGRPCYASYEERRATPPAHLLPRIARLLGLSLEELLTPDN